MNPQLTMFEQYKRSFYNTVKLQGKALSCADTTAKRQEDKVLALFADGKPRNAYEAYVELTHKGETMIKDSVKRSITNLMNEGKLIKTDIKTKGEYHRENVQYKLNTL